LTADRENIEHREAQTLAETVSEQVRGIVAAAENSAEEILRGAELEAQEIRARASQATERATGEAQRVRERATAQAREYVERLSDSFSALLGRLDTIDREVNALTASLRGEAERLRGELTSLQDELAGATEVSAPGPLGGEVADPVSAASEAPAELATESAKLGDEPIAEFPVAGAGAGAQAEGEIPASEQPTSQDIEGARLIALNMALNGTPREETERYLAENYDVADRQRLLDEVYASIQG
jgi:cell division septum initiation protein DivIVA